MLLPRAAKEPSAKTDTKIIGRGLFITKTANLDQKPTSLVGRCLNNGQRLILSPRRFSIAGKTISAAATARETETKPAIANDLRNVCGKKFRETITSATVRPEKKTVRPAESIVASTALATSACRCRSSRNLLTIRSA